MAKWLPVDPGSVPNHREAHRGRVSYPLLKSFLESGLPVSQLDRTGLQQTLLTLNSCLNAYIKSHNLPIKIFQRMGEIYAARLDVDDQGRPNPKYNDISAIPRTGPLETLNGAGEAEDEDEIPEVTADEVSNRYGIEKNMTAR